MADRGSTAPLGDRAAASVGRAIRRSIDVWHNLDTHQRLTGFTALVLLGTLALPWFQETQFDSAGNVHTLSVTGFGAFTFVEGSIVLVCAAVLTMLFARGEKRAFHLPGGDGAVIAAAGGWCLLLLAWRMLIAPPEHVGSDTGIEWGIMVAVVASVALLGTGLRIRADHKPEPVIEVKPIRPRRRTRGPAADAGQEQLHFKGVDPPRSDSPAADEAETNSPTGDPTAEQLTIPLDDPQDTSTTNDLGHS